MVYRSDIEINRLASPFGGRVTDDLSTEDLMACWAVTEEGFRNTYRVLAADIEQAGLPIQWYEVLARLLRNPEHRLPMNRLAGDIDMTSGGYTKLVDRLEAADLVERVPAVDDRRVIYTSLTDTGRSVAEQALARHEVRLREVLMGTLSAEQMQTLADLMGKLGAAHQPADEPESDTESAG
jgi:DNA-binding MarR family transcriptional regulator